MTHHPLLTGGQAQEHGIVTIYNQGERSVRLVSAADKLHNARAILADYRSVGESLWKRFHGGKTGTLWYYRTLVDILRKTGPAPLVEELERVVSEIEMLTAEDSA